MAIKTTLHIVEDQFEYLDESGHKDLMKKHLEEQISTWKRLGL